jgi:hypothetical protein
LVYSIIDALPPWGLVIVGVLVLALATQLGRLFGRRRPEAEVAVEGSHATTITAALLALLALLLAFAFSGVESRYAERKRLVIDDANAIGTTFLRAGMLDVDQRDSIRARLREYVDLRTTSRAPGEIARALTRSEEIHRALWHQAEEAGARHPRSQAVALFVSSLNELIDLHQKRVTVGISQRLPVVTLGFLGAVAILSMGALGYVSGLVRSRSRFPTAAMIVAVSCVTMMIIDVDRPTSSLFRVGQDAMMDARKSLAAYDASSRASSAMTPPPR